jgi:hypothetical protein
MNQKQTFAALKIPKWCTLFFCWMIIAFVNRAGAQTALPLTDLSAFQAPGANWRIAGDVAADLAANEAFTVTKGTGMLVNLPEKGGKATDLFSGFQHGDADIELDFMMAKGSNSGIYLQGRYEVQLLDSWGKLMPKAGDNGGIYERWDESRGKGSEGYEGYAPRQNASRAPGLWQHLKIFFQAPRFDAAGKKIENAKMLRVELNGVTLHENVEMLGPTRGAMENNEVASGPLRIQGDHGPVAFRNIKINNYDKPRPVLRDLKYTIYKGKFEKEPDYAKLPPEAEGSSVILTSSVAKIPNEYLIRYSGILDVKEPGEYTFNLSASGGGAVMKINKQQVIKTDWSGNAKATLAAGSQPFELLYSKFVEWNKPALGLTVAGPGIREYIISDANTASADVVDPILVEAPMQTLLRSFMDIPGAPRVVHAISVGSPQQVHYTYDMDRGAIIQVWRGGFLDATPMWHDRGDGSSRPTGAVQYFGTPMFAVQKLASADAAWSADSAGTGFRTKGYVLDDGDRPTFRYQMHGGLLEDAIGVLENGQGLQRRISMAAPAAGLYVRLAAGKTIEGGTNGLYLVDDKSYYIKIDDAGGAKPIIRDSNGAKELLLPLQNSVTYSLLF